MPQQSMELKLNSPTGFKPLVFKWPFRSHAACIEQIITTIKFVSIEFPEAETSLVRHVLRDYDFSSYTSMKKVCAQYNKVIQAMVRLWEGTTIRRKTPPSPSLLKHILQIVYHTSVTAPRSLNNYEAFSPDVYGETTFELVTQMLRSLTIDADTVFVDLGSGVGQVVLQVAAMTNLKRCVGIEKADVPSSFAQKMDTNFRFWMAWYGKSFSKYELIKGDFLAEENRRLLKDATVIFANNFAFGPVVDHQLKTRFADMKEGTQIVCSKAFCPIPQRPITDRNVHDFGSIVDVRLIHSKRGTPSVSWTAKPVPFYLHCIDHTRVRQYHDRKRISISPARGRPSKLHFVKSKKTKRLNAVTVAESAWRDMTEEMVPITIDDSDSPTEVENSDVEEIRLPVDNMVVETNCTIDVTYEQEVTDYPDRWLSEFRQQCVQTIKGLDPSDTIKSIKDEIVKERQLQLKKQREQQQLEAQIKDLEEEQEVLRGILGARIADCQVSMGQSQKWMDNALVALLGEDVVKMLQTQESPIPLVDFNGSFFPQ